MDRDFLRAKALPVRLVMTDGGMTVLRDLVRYSNVAWVPSTGGWSAPAAVGPPAETETSCAEDEEATLACGAKSEPVADVADMAEPRFVGRVKKDGVVGVGVVGGSGMAGVGVGTGVGVAGLDDAASLRLNIFPKSFLALFAVGVLGVWVDCCEDDGAVGVDMEGCCSSLGRCEVDEEGVTVDGGLEDDLLDGTSMGGSIEAGPGIPL